MIYTVGVKITVDALTNTADIAFLGNNLGIPIQSPVPTRGYKDTLTPQSQTINSLDHEGVSGSFHMIVTPHLGEISTLKQIAFSGGRTSLVLSQSILRLFGKLTLEN